MLSKNTNCHYNCHHNYNHSTNINDLPWTCFSKVTETLCFKDLISLICSFKNYFQKRSLLNIIYHKAVLSEFDLISNKFLINISEIYEETDLDKYSFSNKEPELKDMFEYIGQKENMLIAGGYPTIFFLERDLDIFPSSDIDIYIFGNCQKETFGKFIDFLESKYGIVSINTHNLYFRMDEIGILNIKLRDIERIIQIIGTTHFSAMDVLMQYDNSHNRCCYYNNNFYVAPDALIAKNTGETIFYHNFYDSKRLDKASKLGLKIRALGFVDHSKLREMREKINKNKYFFDGKYFHKKNNCDISRKNDPPINRFTRKISVKNAKKRFSPVQRESWIKHYNMEKMGDKLFHIPTKIIPMRKIAESSEIKIVTTKHYEWPTRNVKSVLEFFPLFYESDNLDIGSGKKYLGLQQVSIRGELIIDFKMHCNRNNNFIGSVIVRNTEEIKKILHFKKIIDNIFDMSIPNRDKLRKDLEKCLENVRCKTIDVKTLNVKFNTLKKEYLERYAYYDNIEVIENYIGSVKYVSHVIIKNIKCVGFDKTMGQSINFDKLETINNKLSDEYGGDVAKKYRRYFGKDANVQLYCRLFSENYQINNDLISSESGLSDSDLSDSYLSDSSDFPPFPNHFDKSFILGKLGHATFMMTGLGDFCDPNISDVLDAHKYEWPDSPYFESQNSNSDISLSDSDDYIYY